MNKNVFKKEFSMEKTIFIVEDNEAYASAIGSYINAWFPEIQNIQFFPVGESCIDNLHLNPDIIIMDYFLNSQYGDAVDGLETIIKIRNLQPQINIVLLSSQKNVEVESQAVDKYKCSYIQKDKDAFNNLGNLIREIFSIN